MKKEYINPSIEIIKISTVHMLADSMGKGEGTRDASLSDSRGYGSEWDEWDDDEY